MIQEKERERKEKGNERKRKRERGRGRRGRGIGRERGRGRGRERERIRERERKIEREREGERTDCFCKRRFFLLLAPGSSLEKFAAIGKKPLKWIEPSHGPVPWKFVEKLFFNNGLISGLILLGKVWLWIWQSLVEKAFLSSLGSRISSGKVCCNCEPWEQTY